MDRWKGGNLHGQRHLRKILGRLRRAVPHRRGAVLRGKQGHIFIGIHPGQSQTLQKCARMKDGENPFIDRAAWPSFLSQLEKNAREMFGNV